MTVGGSQYQATSTIALPYVLRVKSKHYFRMSHCCCTKFDVRCNFQVDGFFIIKMFGKQQRTSWLLLSVSQYEKMNGGARFHSNLDVILSILRSWLYEMRTLQNKVLFIFSQTSQSTLVMFNTTSGYLIHKT